MKKEKIYIKPEICMYNSEDDKNLIIELSIPGVKKDDIDFRMIDDRFILKAPGHDIYYTISEVLCCPVISAQAVADYNEGLLSVKIPFKDPFENAIKVKVA